MRMRRAQSGFTLVEAIIAIVITGIVAGVVGMFIRTPIQQYTDMANRAALTDAADTALRRIGRDLRRAVPNSIRIPVGKVECMEFIPTITGGRYRVAGPGNVLDLSSPTTTFDVLNDLTLGGKLQINDIAKGDVVIYNLSSENGNPLNAYSGSNRAAIASVNANSIILNGAKQFSVAPDYVLGDYDGKHFQVTEESGKSVFYVCEGVGISGGNGTGKLRRLFSAYSPAAPASCPTIPEATPILVENVSGCAFTYEPVNETLGLVKMTLSLTRNNETVTLYHEVHVNNIP